MTGGDFRAEIGTKTAQFPGPGGCGSRERRLQGCVACAKHSNIRLRLFGRRTVACGTAVE